MIATEHAFVGSTNPTFTVKNAPSHYSDPPPPYITSYCNYGNIPDASDNQSTINTDDGGVSSIPPPSYSSICRAN